MPKRKNYYGEDDGKPRKNTNYGGAPDMTLQEAGRRCHAGTITIEELFQWMTQAHSGESLHGSPAINATASMTHILVLGECDPDLSDMPDNISCFSVINFSSLSAPSSSG